MEELASSGGEYAEDVLKIRNEIGLFGRLQTPAEFDCRFYSLARELSEPAQQVELAAALKAWYDSGGRPKLEERAAKPPDYELAVRIGWQWLALLAKTQQQVERQQIQEVLRFVDESPQRPSTDQVEVHFLRMMDAYLDWQNFAGARQREQSVARAILTRQEAGAFDRLTDDRSQYWIHEDVDKIDADRRQAEDLMFVGSDEAYGRAIQLLSIPPARQQIREPSTARRTTE